MNPKVSIVTPVYNAERFLPDCIESVLAQEYENWEQIFVDDFSKDNSVKIIEEYAKKDARIKLILQEKNKGSGPARNRAIKLADGDIIAFLDSDDIWLPTKLKHHVKFMIENDAVFSHTSYGFINEAGTRINKTYHVSKYPVDYNHLLKRTEISCLTAMYNCNRIGKFYMPNLRRKQDYGLWLSILKTGIKSIPLDEELALYRQVKGSATSNKSKLITKHLVFLYKHQNLGFFKTIYYFFWWGVNGINKYYINRYFN